MHPPVTSHVRELALALSGSVPSSRGGLGLRGLAAVCLYLCLDGIGSEMAVRCGGSNTHPFGLCILLRGPYGAAQAAGQQPRLSALDSPGLLGPHADPHILSPVLTPRDGRAPGGACGAPLAVLSGPRALGVLGVWGILALLASLAVLGLGDACLGALRCRAPVGKLPVKLCPLHAPSTWSSRVVFVNDPHLQLTCLVGACWVARPPCVKLPTKRSLYTRVQHVQLGWLWE